MGGNNSKDQPVASAQSPRKNQKSEKPAQKIVPRDWPTTSMAESRKIHMELDNNQLLIKINE